MVSKVNLRLYHFISAWWISIVCQMHSSSDRFCITFVSAYCFLHFPVFVASDAHLFSPHARFRNTQFSHYSDLASSIFSNMSWNGSSFILPSNNQHDPTWLLTFIYLAILLDKPAVENAMFIIVFIWFNFYYTGIGWRENMHDTLHVGFKAIVSDHFLLNQSIDA
jgi:hypothetical protein